MQGHLNREAPALIFFRVANSGDGRLLCHAVISGALYFPPNKAASATYGRSLQQVHHCRDVPPAASRRSHPASIQSIGNACQASDARRLN